MHGQPSQPSGSTVEAIFNDAVELEPAARAAFLAKVCGDDLDLRRRVQALLQADEVTTDFLPEQPSQELPMGILQEVQSAAIEQPGDSIGRYKLLQKLGEGGCGIVYLAEQQQPLRRRVALKILKLGMDTKQVIARFEAERQALALMDHPNIAKVLDAGSTEKGRPYFVMELVRGTKITDFCDQQALSTAERLSLFVQVCQAIQHAHQKGIIHRDIKPSNILVTVKEPGSPGVPKVIDFGIAKAITGQPLTDLTVFTEFQQFIGTPAYMSPEQAVMTSMDVDTRTDLYSLGVLLYELLTGKTPFDTQALLKAGLDEMRRTIRESEPVRPSTRLSTMVEGELTVAAKHRHAEPPKLIHLLRGDLDWIVMKCLEKDRARRYETANGLALDIQRYLNNEPVLARPPSRLYRFQKLARRNKVLFGAAAALLSVLLLGVVVSTLEARRAQSAERQAITDAGRAKQAEAVALEKSRLAEQERQRAQISELTAQRNLYAADMNLAALALESHHLPRARELLNAPRSADLRGWEWRYLAGLCHGDDIRVLCRAETPISEVRLAARGGPLAAISDFSNLVRLWDSDTHQPLPALQAFPPSSDPSGPNGIQAGAFAPDGHRLAVANNKGEIRIWDLTERRLLSTLTIQLQDPIYFSVGLAFSPNGKLLARAGDRTARIWDLSVDPPREVIIERRSLDVQRMGFSPDGRILVVAGEDKPVRFYDISDPHSPVLLPQSLELRYIVGLTFSPDGTRLALVGSNETGVHIYEFPSLKKLPPLPSYVTIAWDIAFSPDSRRVAFPGSDGTIAVVDLADPEHPRTLMGHEDRINSIVFFPDGKTLVSGSDDGTVRLWDITAAPPPQPGPTLGGWIHDLCFSPDSKYVAVLTALSPNGIRLEEAATHRELAKPEFPSGQEGQLEFSPDGKSLCVCTKGQASFFTVPELKFQKQEPARRFVFSKDGSFGILLRQDQVVRRDLKSGAEIILGSNPIPASRLALSPDGGMLAIGGDAYDVDLGGPGRISLWNASQTGTPVELESHRLAVYGLAFSPDGKLLASGSWDGSMGIWDVASRRKIKSLRGHGGEIFSLNFSSDGRTLASCADDGTIKFWNLASLQEALTLQSRQGPVTAIAFSPDGRHLASAAGWRVSIWSAPTFDEIAANRTLERK